MNKAVILLFLALPACAAELGISDASPQRVQEMATDIAGQRYSDLTQQARFEQAYLAGFKSGMTSPYGTAMMGSGKPDDPRSAGFSLGRDTAISNAAALNVTLLDYGYDHTNVTGFVSLAFEQSEFRPVGSTQVWWIAYTPELAHNYSALVAKHHVDRPEKTAILASLAGYLSPEKSWGYGHFGAYRRELVVTRINEIRIEEEPQQSVPGCPPQGVGSPAP